MLLPKVSREERHMVAVRWMACRDVTYKISKGILPENVAKEVHYLEAVDDWRAKLQVPSSAPDNILSKWRFKVNGELLQSAMSQWQAAACSRKVKQVFEQGSWNKVILNSNRQTKHGDRRSWIMTLMMATQLMSMIGESA